MTTTRVFKSTDAGAPVLTGVVSKMIDLLDAVLVNGYNSKTITITRSGDTATATCTAHGFLAEQVVLISGATPSDYNGEFRILTAAANTFTFEVLGSPTTPPTGTITCIMAPAGWTKPYTGTNKAAFQNSAAAGGTGMLLRVLDDASVTGGARDASCVVYTTMSDVDTGTNICPNTTQHPSGVLFRKSSTADSTARPWQIWADERTCYVWVEPVTSGTYATRQSLLYAFGDFDTLLGSDGFAYFIAGNTSTAASASVVASSRIGQMPPTSAGVFTDATDPTGFYVPKRYQQDTGPKQVSTWAGSVAGTTGITSPAFGGTSSWIKHPDTGTSLKLFMPAYVVEPSCFRGRLRGLYAPMGDLVTGSTASVVRETSIAGVPAGSALDTVRQDANGSNNIRAYLAIEALLSW